MRGVLNLRGVIVPIVDLRCRFGQGLTETTPLHIVIIVQIGGRQVGLIGDRVLDIVSVDAAQIQKVPRTGHGEQTDFLSGLVTDDSVMIALIDLLTCCRCRMPTPPNISSAAKSGIVGRGHRPHFTWSSIGPKMRAITYACR